MTTRRATVLSVIGVVAAGLIAGLVNTQALAGAERRGDGLLSGPQPAPTVAPSTVAPSTVASSGPNETGTTMAAIAPATVLHSFAAGPAGTITVDGSSGSLTLVAVVPAEGWLISGVTSDGATRIDVGFASMDERLVATAVLADGEITATVAAAASAPASVPPDAASSAPPSVAATVPATTATRPVASEPPPPATGSVTTTTVQHDDDDAADDHGEDSGEDPGDDHGEDSGEDHEDHEEPDD